MRRRHVRPCRFRVRYPSCRRSRCRSSTVSLCLHGSRYCSLSLISLLFRFSSACARRLRLMMGEPQRFGLPVTSGTSRRARAADDVASRASSPPFCIRLCLHFLVSCGSSCSWNIHPGTCRRAAWSVGSDCRRAAWSVGSDHFICITDTCCCCCCFTFTAIPSASASSSTGCRSVNSSCCCCCCCCFWW